MLVISHCVMFTLIEPQSVNEDPCASKSNCESEQVPQVLHVFGQCVLASASLHLPFFSTQPHFFVIVLLVSESSILKRNTLSKQDPEDITLGTDDGLALDIAEGAKLGFSEGHTLRNALGSNDGSELDVTLGTAVGANDGAALGDDDGSSLGANDVQDPHEALQVLEISSLVHLF